MLGTAAEAADGTDALAVARDPVAATPPAGSDAVPMLPKPAVCWLPLLLPLLRGCRGIAPAALPMPGSLDALSFARLLLVLLPLLPPLPLPSSLPLPLPPPPLLPPPPPQLSTRCRHASRAALPLRDCRSNTTAASPLATWATQHCQLSHGTFTAD